MGKLASRTASSPTTLQILWWWSILTAILFLPNVSPAASTDVQAAVRGSAKLPCDISDPNSSNPPNSRHLNDDVLLVLWYREDLGRPIYSLDARTESLQKALHWSDESVFGRRAHFDIGATPAVLTIQNLAPEDQGKYRCRVHFKVAPSRNSFVNLNVVDETKSKTASSPSPRGITQPKCVSFCKESAKFGLQPGTTTRYNYRTDLRTFAAGASAQESRIHLTAAVEITALTGCEQQLELKDIRLTESHPTNRQVPGTDLPNSAQLIRELIETPLRFSFQDGKVEHICSENQEQRWALNVKRGILSVLQNTMDDLNRGQTVHESDVHGRCLTRYDLTADSQGRLVKRTKNFKSCSQRSSHVSAIQSVPYASSSPVQNIPLLNGAQECTQTIRNRQLIKVECVEEHKFQPFDRTSSAVTTVVSQSLVYESSRTAPSLKQAEWKDFKKLSLTYDTQRAEDTTDGNIQEILDLLVALERESVPKVSVYAPEKFTDLVTRLRSVNYAVISTLFNKAPSDVGRTFLVDALPLVGTAPALTFMREMFSSGKLTEIQIDAWLTSIAFIKHPSLEMIPAIASLLDGEPRNQALLAISSVIHSYCRDHDDCGQEAPVQDVLRKILSFLGSGCKLSKYGDRELTRAIFSLKAIGNAGRLPTEHDDKSFQLLRKCFEDVTNPLEGRLAALESFRRIPCDHYESTPFSAIYQNMKEDTEIRIGAYLVAMKCPSRELVDVVKDTLYTDTVNQVGSFVWTHLTNLQETSSPDKQSLKDLLSNDFLKNKFNTDARKFSRNYEASRFSDELNIGAGLESNVVFAPSSFLPRSVTLNTTINLFGESVNLLEIGGRVHSLEPLLESVFGPTGYFPEPHVSEALNSIRTKRTASNNQIERLGQVFNQAGLNRDNLPGGSLFLRVFGNEISYKHFEFSHKQTAPTLVDENGHNWLDITYLFDNMGTGKRAEFVKSNVIMDSRYIVPTGAGLPLSLGIQAASTVGVKASGKIDLANFWDEQEVDIHGALEPSGAIQLDGQLAVTIGRSNSNLKSGVKFQNSLHTATGIQARVLIKGTNVVHASITVPQAKQEILEVKSQLVLMSPTDRHTEVIGGQRLNSDFKVCTPDVVSTVLGLKFCGSATVPDDMSFPLLQPAALSLTVEKTDTFNSYEFDYKWLGSETGDRQDVSILFNTPGSQVDRRLAVTYVLDTAQGKLEASIETPRKSLTAQGMYSKTTQNLQLSLRSKEEQILLVSTGLRRQMTRLEPHLTVSYYAKPIVDVQGVMYLANILETDGKANVDLTLKYLSEKPIQLTGEVTRQRDAYNGRIGIDSSLVTGNIRSQVRVRPGLVTSKAEIQYSWRGAAQVLNFGGKFSKMEKGALVKYAAVASLSSPQFSHLNTDFSWETAMARGYIENNIKVLVGKSKWEGKSLFKNQFRRQLEDVQFLISLTAPQNGLDYFLDFQHQKNQTGIFCHFTGRLDPRNELRAQAEYLRTNEKLLKRNFNAHVSWPGSTHALRSGITEVRIGEYESELVILPNGSNQKQAKVSYKNASNKRRQDHVLEARAENFLAVPISYSGKFVASERESLMTSKIQIDGNERYSGMWSGSFEYSASKRFAHKMEAKVDLNGVSYSGDLNWRQSRSGDQTYTADIHASQHFYSELLLRQGDDSDLFWGKVTVIPNKEFYPNDKVMLEGKVNSESVKGQMNYFGQVISLNGVYRPDKIELEAELDSKRFAFTLDTQSTTLERFKVAATLMTPVNGYSSLGFTIDHTYNGNTLNTKGQGHWEGKTAGAAIYGNLDIPQSTFSVMLEGSGMDKLATVAKMSTSGDTRLLEVTTQKGVQTSVFKGQLSATQRSRTIKIDFSGCSVVPAIYAEYNRQKTSEVTDNLVLRWTPTGGEGQTLEGRITHLQNPFKTSFLLTTPWKGYEKFEGRFSIFESDLNKELKMYINGPATLFPLTFEVKLGGNLDEFGQSVSVTWFQNARSRTQKSIHITSTGRLSSLDDAEWKISAKVPNHRYDLEVVSGRTDDTGLQIDSKITYDDETVEGGLVWLVQSFDKIQTSVWAKLPNQPKMIFSFAHMRRSDSYLMDLSCGLDDRSMSTFKVDMKQEGWMKWDMTAVLSSPLNFIPDIDISSRHDFRDIDMLDHKTEYSVRTPSELLGGTNDERGVFIFQLRDGKLKTSFSFGTDYFNVEGQASWDERFIKGKATTPFFPNFDVTFSAIMGKVEGGKIDIDLNENGTSLYHWQVMWVGKDSVNGIRLHLDCPMGHTIKVNGKVDLSDGLLELDLAETKQDLIKLKLKTQVGGVEGQVELTLDGKGHDLFTKKSVDAKYRLFPGKVEVEAKYETSKGKGAVTGVGEFTSARKQLEVKVTGSQELTYTLALHGNRRLEALATRSGQRVFALTTEYDLDMGDFSFGKHTIKGALVTQRQKPYGIQGVIGLDLSKVLLQLDTPFEPFKKFSLEGEFSLEGTKNLASLNIRRDLSSYNIKVQSASTKNSGSVEVTIETPWKGYQRISYKGSYDKNGDVLRGSIQGSMDKGQLTLRTSYTPTQVDFDLATPFDPVKKLLISAQWTKGQSNALQITASLNQRSHLLRFLWELNPVNGFGQVTLGGEEAGTAEFKYDFRQGYNAEASVDFSGRKHQIGGQFVMEPNEIRIELHTPFAAFQNFGAKGTLSRPTSTTNKVALTWNLNGQENQLTGEATLTPTSVAFELQTPLNEPWNKIKGKGGFEGTASRKTLKLEMHRGKDKFQMQSQLTSSGQFSNGDDGNLDMALKITVDSTVSGWEHAESHAQYKQTGNSHRVAVDLSKDVEILNSEVSFTLPKNQGQEMTIRGSVDLPQVKFTGGVDLAIKVDLAGETSVRAKLSHNGVDYSCAGAFTLNTSAFKVEATSSFAPVRNFVASGNYGRLSDTALSVQLNEKVIDLKLQGSFNGLRQFKVNCDISTPFEGYRTLHGEAQLGLSQRHSTGSFKFQNDRVRYMGKMEGRFGSDSGEIRVQFNSPLYKLENVVWSLKFGDSKAMIRMERNTKEDIKMEASLQNGQLLFGLVSNLPAYPISSRSLIDWRNAPVSAQVHLESGPASDSLNFRCKIEGFRVGHIEVHTKVKGYETINLEWLLEGTLAQGTAKLSYDLPIYGQRSFRSSWKQDNYKSLDAEFFWNENQAPERGLSVQYSWASLRTGLNKFSASVSYVGNQSPQALKLTLSVKNEESSARLIDFSLKTPFPPMQDLNLSGKIILGREVNIDISSSLNRQPALTISSTLVAEPLMSKLKLIFNAPAISEPFNLNAIYDLRTNDKHVEVFFAQKQYKLNVKAQATVSKDDPQEIELRMNVDSNIPSVTVSASASLRAGYKIESDGTRQVTISIDSLQTGNWRGVASIRPRADFNLKVRLESPIPEIVPSVKSELGWQRTQQGLTGNLAFQMASHDLIAMLTLASSEVKVTLTSGYPGLENVSVQGKMESGEGTVNKKLSVDIKVAGQEITLTSNVMIPTNGGTLQSSIRLTSSWEVIPNAAIEASLASDGKLAIQGNWGSRTVEVNGNFQGKKGKSVFEAAESDMTLSVNEVELLTLRSHHFFTHGQYSWNATVGTDFGFASFLEQVGERSVFSGHLKWADSGDGLRISGETNKGRLRGSLKSPWASEIEVSGRYKVEDKEYSADGFVTYEGVKSGLRAELITKEDAIAARMSVDVPVLGQKVDSKIHLKMADKSNVVGMLEMSMGDRRVSVKGSLKTSQYKSSTYGLMSEQKLDLSLSLPRSDYVEVSSNWNLRRPLSGWHHADLEGSLTLPKRNHKGSFLYDLPIAGHEQLRARWFLDCEVIAPSVIKGSFEAQKFKMDDFQGGLRYGENEFEFGWLLGKNFNFDVTAHVPSILHESSPLRLQAEGVIDLGQEFRVRSTVTANRDSSTVEGNVLLIDGGFDLRLFGNIPAVQSQPLETGFKVRNIGNGKTVLDLSGSLGQESFGAIGEVVSSQSTVSASLKVSGSYGAHFGSFAATKKSAGHFFEINGESQNLFKGKKVNIVGTFLPAQSGFTASVECRTKQATHALSVKFDIGKQGSIVVKFDSPIADGLLFDSSYSISPDKIEVKIMANGENTHKFEITADQKQKEIKLYVHCPYVHHQPLFAHARSRTGENEISFIGDLDTFGNRFRGEGTLRYENYRDMEVKLEVMTPFKSFDKITIAGKFGTDVAEIEFTTPVDDLPNFVVKCSGINFFDDNDFSNFHPKLTVGLAQIKYSAGGSFQIPSESSHGKFGAHLEQHQLNEEPERYDLYVTMTPYDRIRLDMDDPIELKIEANSPIDGFRHFEILLGGNIIWKKWSDLTAEAKFNDQKLLLTSRLQNDGDNRKLEVNFRSPFKGYEQFGLQALMQNYEEIGAGHNIHVEVQRPWGKPLGIEVDYRIRYNGLGDIEGDLKLVPEMLQMSPISLSLRSEVKDSKYGGVLEGSWGTYRPILRIDGSVTSESFLGSIEGKMGAESEYQVLTKVETLFQPNRFSFATEMALNYNQLFLFSTGIIREQNLMEGEIRLKTPFEAIRSGAAIYRLSLLKQQEVTFDTLVKNIDMTFGLSHNDLKVIHIEVVNKQGKRVLDIHNPFFRPVSLSVGYDVSPSSTSTAMAEICWDLTARSESTVGFNVGWQLKNKAFTVKLHGGKYGFVEVGGAHMRSDKTFDHLVSLKWNQPKAHGAGEAGYRIFWKEDSKTGSARKELLRMRADLPWRSIEFERQRSSTNKEQSESALIRWDVKRDPTKQTGYRLLTSKGTAWRSSTKLHVLSIIHSALAHDVTFTLHRRYTNFALQGVSFVFQPNPFPQNALTVEFKRDGIRNKEARFLMTHPSTNTEVMGHFKAGDSTVTVALSHMMMSGQKAQVNLEMASDVHGTFIDGSTGTGQLIKFEYKPSLDQPRLYIKTRSIEISGDLVTSPPLIRGGVKYESGRELTLTAGLPHTKEVSFKVARTDFGMNIKDLVVAFKLNASQILSTKVHWRPQTADELKQIVTDTVPRAIQRFWSEEVPKALTVVNDEIEERLALIDPSVRDAYVDLKEFSKDEVKVIFDEVTRAVRYVQQVHHRNTFYTKDLVKLVKNLVNKIYTAWSDSIEGLKALISNVFKAIGAGLSEVKRIWKENGGKFETALMPLWDAAEDRIRNGWNALSKTVRNVFRTLTETYKTLGHILDGNLAELQKTFKGLDIVRKISEMYEDYCNWISELSIQEYIDEGYQMLYEFVWRPLEVLYKPYLEAWNSALEEGNISAILEMPPVPYLRFLTNRLLGVANRFWVFVEAEQKVKSLFRNILARLDLIIQSHIPTTNMVWDVDKGHIEYHQPLTFFEWNHFNEFPRFKESQSDIEHISHIQTFYSDLLDTLRNAKPVMEMDVRDMLPPFETTALLAGDHHFLTFDQTYFRFAGDCSYILATDLLHQNLTLMVNYDNGRKKSYSLMTGASTVDIDAASLLVKVDGRVTDTPFTVGPTFVRRQRSGLEVIDTRGFQMRCSQASSVCRISLSGWYFGKVGGLLGNYDNEKLNDLRTPDGTVVTDVANFAHSWRVGAKSGQCQMKNYANKSDAGVEDNLCTQMLNSTSSPLRPCFKTVDVDIYRKMCQFDVKNDRGDKSGRICTAVAAYVMQCQRQGVDIWMPPMCVKCKLEGGSQMRSGENMTYSPEHSRPPNAADVVFLIEEAGSLRDYNLVDAVKKLEAALKTEGIDNNRYAIVGFGGKGGRAKPHLRTSNTEVWSPMASFKVSDPSIMDGDGKGDLYEAIDFAAAIGYRAGVSKTIVAVVTSLGHCEDNVRYSDTLTLLLENDIRLHILTPQDFSLKVDTKQDEGSRIFGVDMEGAYTVRQMKRGPVEGDRALRRQVKISKDLCTPLALETNGTVFNVKMVQRPAIAKKFVDVWSRRVSATAAPSDCQLCECLPDRDGGAITLCIPCISPNLQKFIDDLNTFEQNQGTPWVD